MKIKNMLLGSPRLTPKKMLAHLSDCVGEDEAVDFYGQGKIINDFEKEVADLLGHEAAVFMPSGTMAQQIALKIYFEKNDKLPVGFHPLSHLELHEQDGYKRLHAMKAELVGEVDRVITKDDIKSKLSALLYELPQREIGGVLPAWTELLEVAQKCKDEKIAFHLDGARLWESAPYYGKSLNEIAGLFDSVYVSFYKTLNGLPGAILAGSEDFIKEAKVWLRRHGGNLFHLYPNIVSARQVLRDNLSKIPDYCERAKEVAVIINEFEGIKTYPEVPATNMFHILFKNSPEQVNKALETIVNETGTDLFHPVSENKYLDDSYQSKTEASIGERALEFSDELLRKSLKTLLS